MSDTTLQNCNCCEIEDDCIDGLCQCCAIYNQKLQKQSDLLTLGLLQEKNKYAALKASHKKIVESLEQIRDLETDCCSRCEGEGNIYADGKAHYMSENAPTILCGNCGGSGRILPEDAQDIAEQALKEAEKI